MRRGWWVEAGSGVKGDRQCGDYECYLVRINYKEAHDFDLTQIGNVKRLIADLEIIVLEMLYLLEIDNV